MWEQFSKCLKEDRRECQANLSNVSWVLTMCQGYVIECWENTKIFAQIGLNILRITLEIDSSCVIWESIWRVGFEFGLWHLRWGNDIPGARNEQREKGRVHGVLGFTVVGAWGGKFLMKDHDNSNR